MRGLGLMASEQVDIQKNSDAVRKMEPGGKGFMPDFHFATALLGGSWVVRSGAIRRITIVIAHVRGLTTPKP